MAGIDAIPSDRAASNRPCPAMRTSYSSTSTGAANPKLADTGGNLSNLLLRMCTGVFGVRPDLLDRQVSVRVGHDDAPFAGACALTRMGRQNQMGKAASY